MPTMVYNMERANVGTLQIQISDEPTAAIEAELSCIYPDGGAYNVGNEQGTCGVQALPVDSLAQGQRIWANVQRTASIAARSTGVLYRADATGAYTDETNNYGVWEDYTPTSARNVYVKWSLVKASTTDSYADYDCGTTSAKTWYRAYNTTATSAYTWADDGWYDCQSGWVKSKHLLTPAERLAEIMRDRQCPGIRTTRKSLAVQAGDDREMRARETLRMILGEERYRRFLVNGFVSATNPRTGYTYQIFHSSHHLTHVYKDGKMVRRLCIYLAGNFPPTDFVITLYLMALNNDQRIWDIANKQEPVVPQERKLITDMPSLVDIYRKLKEGKAA